MVTLRVIFFSGIQQFLDLLHKIELVCDLEKKPKESEKKCLEIRGGGGGGGERIYYLRIKLKGRPEHNCDYRCS